VRRARCGKEGESDPGRFSLEDDEVAMDTAMAANRGLNRERDAEVATRVALGLQIRHSVVGLLRAGGSPCLGWGTLTFKT